MKITVCGSMHHINNMLEVKQVLEKLGYTIDVPDLTEANGNNALSQEEKIVKKEYLIRQHLRKISQSDAIFVYNGEKNGTAGYVGGNTLMEMAFAYVQGIEIFLLNDAQAMSCSEEIYGMKPIVLHGDIEAADHYFRSLPKTFVSSKSPIKLLAVSRGMRKAGIRTLVVPKPTESKVASQPTTIEETYQGAQNRHAALKVATKDDQPAYLATVESGLTAIHPNHNEFSCTITILEKASSVQKVGVNVEVEFPKAMTDKVPSEYPDLGELVQVEYGSVLKDPFPYFTNHKVDRLQLVETAVFNVAVQVEVV